VAVAEVLNFRAAAKGLHVSAPALSQQIKNLEEEIGVLLFDRDTKGVRLTAAGRVFLEESKALISKACKAQDLAREASRGVSGRLRVGYNSAILAEYMPRSLMAFTAKFPSVLVELVDLNAAEQIDALATDVIQLAFIAPPIGWALPPHLADAQVLHVKSRAVLGQGHQLAKKSALSLRDLSTDRILVMSGPKWAVHREHIWRMFKAHDVPLGEVVDVARLDALLTMVAGGEGVSILGWRRSMAYADQISILRIKESGPEMEWDIRAVWRKSACTNAQKGFVDVVRATASAYGKD
jgi:DNA-binding transcriptional LysR family regulator